MTGLPAAGERGTPISKSRPLRERGNARHNHCDKDALSLPSAPPPPPPTANPFPFPLLFIFHSPFSSSCRSGVASPVPLLLSPSCSHTLFLDWDAPPLFCSFNSSHFIYTYRRGQHGIIRPSPFCSPKPLLLEFLHVEVLAPILVPERSGALLGPLETVLSGLLRLPAGVLGSESKLFQSPLSFLAHI